MVRDASILNSISHFWISKLNAFLFWISVPSRYLRNYAIITLPFRFIPTGCSQYLRKRQVLVFHFGAANFLADKTAKSAINMTPSLASLACLACPHFFKKKKLKLSSLNVWLNLWKSDYSYNGHMKSMKDVPKERLRKSATKGVIHGHEL